MSETIDNLVHLLVLIFLMTTILIPSLRKGLLSRKRGEWFLDVVSLGNHFFTIPLIQTAVLYKLYSVVLPGYKSSLSISPLVALLLYMLVDYGWYWNHRLLHSRTKLWNFHMVHHAAEHLDVLATPRNTFWSPLLMVYMWVFSLILYLVSNPMWFLIFASIGLLINFWGHTNFNFSKNGLVNKALSLFLITPREHFWHHSTENSYCNFATVFNFWDKIHGTFHGPPMLPKKLGFPINMSITRQVFFPFDKDID